MRVLVLGATGLLGSAVFHVLSAEDIYKLKKLEGGKKTISAFFTMMSRYLEGGIAAGGGVVAELEADVIVSARDDIMSQVDKAGRRWVEMSWFENALSWGTPAGFNNVERGLDDLIRNLVLKHLEPILGNRARTDHEYVLWGNMKRELKDSKKLSLVIKDYFDGVEKIIKDNKDLVIGARVPELREKDAVTPQQVFGNWLACSLMKLFFKATFTDLGPFRAIKYDKLLALNMSDKTYGWTVEMQLKALKNKYSYTEIPVHYKKRIGVSKVSGTIKGSIFAGIKILTWIFKYSLK